jgi:hypothetical protein
MFFGAGDKGVSRFSTEVAPSVGPSSRLFSGGGSLDTLDYIVVEFGRWTGGDVSVLPLSGKVIHGGKTARGVAGTGGALVTNCPIWLRWPFLSSSLAFSLFSKANNCPFYSAIVSGRVVQTKASFNLLLNPISRASV